MKFLRFLLLVLAALPALGADAPLAEPSRWLADYLRIDTTNPPGNEAQAVDFLEAILQAEGIPTQRLVTSAGRTSLYARLASSAAGPRPTLVLLHHMDVVAPGPGWSIDPFAGEVRDGRLWGRGAIDAKSLGIAHLAAMVELKRRSVALSRDLIFLAVADEEAGGGQGTGWVLEHHPELFGRVEAVLNEGGSNRVTQGKLAWWGIEVAQKRPLWLAVSTTGRGGHGSNLNLHSASHALIGALNRLLERPLTYRVSGPARAYFGALADLHDDKWRPIFGNLDAAIQASGPTVGLLPGMPNWFLDTIQVTMLAAGHKINVIPNEATAQLDIRLLPDTDAEQFLTDVRQTLGQRVEVEVLLSAPPAAASPTDHPLFRLLQRRLEAEAPVVPAFIPGFTDSRYFRQRGIPAYGFSPFALEGSDLRGIHQVDERVPLGEFYRGVQKMTALVTEYVTVDPSEP